MISLNNVGKILKRSRRVVRGVLLPGAYNLLTLYNNSRSLKTAISLLVESVLSPPVSPDMMSQNERVKSK